MDKKKVRLLIVDGEEDYYRLISEYAEICRHQYDIECRHVASGNDALGEIRSWEPSLILLDAHMPDLGGFDILPHCRPLSASVVIMSDSPSADIEESARERGADGYLSKSENPDEMESLLELFVSLSSEKFAPH